jgi:hypothetical protein
MTMYDELKPKGAGYCRSCGAVVTPEDLKRNPIRPAPRNATPARHGWRHADDGTECMEPAWCPRDHCRVQAAPNSSKDLE